MFNLLRLKKRPETGKHGCKEDSKEKQEIIS